jgi:membrane-bound metal-dependent hydrolase YbcI (DUF457 family)
MRLREHVIIGGAAVVVLFPFWGFWQSLLFWVSAVLIDADHYLDYLWKTGGKDWSPARMFRYYDHVIRHKNDPHNLGFSLLHTIEMFLLVYLLALTISYTFFMTILAGMLFHIILDMLWLSYHRLFFVRSYSLVEHFIRTKKMIKKGLNPQHFYDRMFDLSSKK